MLVPLVFVWLMPELGYQQLTGFGQGSMDQNTVPWATQLTAEARERWLDRLYTLGGDGLGLNLCRTYICAGDNPAHHHMDRRPGGSQAPLGYEQQPGQYQWDGHEVSLWHAQGAARRGARMLAFWNSPPWWMTESGCTCGSVGGKSDNLKREHESDFVRHIVAVLQHYRDAWGLDFEWVCPINEPEADWWTALDGQDGCHVSPEQARRLLALLGPALRRAGLRARIQAFEAAFAGSHSYLDALLADPVAERELSLLTTHQYFGGDGDLRGWWSRAERSRRPLWMSEWGDWKLRGLPQAMGYADKIGQALRYGGVEAWCMWEPGLIAELRNGQVEPRKAWYAVAHYSRYARPGMQVIDSVDLTGRTTAFLDRAARRLVVVTVNRGDEARTWRYDVSAFRGLQPTEVVRTTAAENLAPQPLPTAGRTLDLELPAQSIVTWVARYESLEPALLADPGFDTGQGWTATGDAGTQISYSVGGLRNGYLHPTPTAGAALRQTVRGLRPGATYRLAAAAASSDIPAVLTLRSGASQATATASGGAYRALVLEVTAAADGTAEISYETAPQAGQHPWATLDSVRLSAVE